MPSLETPIPTVLNPIHMNLSGALYHHLSLSDSNGLLTESSVIVLPPECLLLKPYAGPFIQILSLLCSETPFISCRTHPRTIQYYKIPFTSLSHLLLTYHFCRNSSHTGALPMPGNKMYGKEGRHIGTLKTCDSLQPMSSPGLLVCRVHWRLMR